MEAISGGTSMDYVPVTEATVEHRLDLLAYRGPLTPAEVAELRNLLKKSELDGGGPEATKRAIGVKMDPYLKQEDAARDDSNAAMASGLITKVFAPASTTVASDSASGEK